MMTGSTQLEVSPKEPQMEAEQASSTSMPQPDDTPRAVFVGEPGGATSAHRRRRRHKKKARAASPDSTVQAQSATAAAAAATVSDTDSVGSMPEASDSENGSTHSNPVGSWWARRTAKQQRLKALAREIADIEQEKQKIKQWLDASLEEDSGYFQVIVESNGERIKVLNDEIRDPELRRMLLSENPKKRNQQSEVLLTLEVNLLTKQIEQAELNGKHSETLQAQLKQASMQRHSFQKKNAVVEKAERDSHALKQQKALAKLTEASLAAITAHLGRKAVEQPQTADIFSRQQTQLQQRQTKLRKQIHRKKAKQVRKRRLARQQQAISAAKTAIESTLESTEPSAAWLAGAQGLTICFVADNFSDPSVKALFSQLTTELPLAGAVSEFSEAEIARRYPYSNCLFETNQQIASLEAELGSIDSQLASHRDLREQALQELIAARQALLVWISESYQANGQDADEEQFEFFSGLIHAVKTKQAEFSNAERLLQHLEAYRVKLPKLLQAKQLRRNGILARGKQQLIKRTQESLSATRALQFEQLQQDGRTVFAESIEHSGRFQQLMQQLDAYLVSRDTSSYQFFHHRGLTKKKLTMARSVKEKLQTLNEKLNAIEACVPANAQVDDEVSVEQFEKLEQAYQAFSTSYRETTHLLTESISQNREAVNTERQNHCFFKPAPSKGQFGAVLENAAAVLTEIQQRAEQFFNKGTSFSDYHAYAAAVEVSLQEFDTQPEQYFDKARF